MATIWDKLHAVHKYTFLAEQFPRFMAAFEPLHIATQTIFNRRIDGAATPDIIVYYLGRLCLEDFTEILFLSAHDYGYAAIKLLRGLYERSVVNEIIIENPEKQGDRFFNYYAVDAMKFQNRSKNVYQERWTKDYPDLERWFAEVKNDYKYQKCNTCSQTPQAAWTDHGLDALAGALGK